MEKAILKGEIREKIGKNPSRAIRNNGGVPAIVYGPEVPNGSVEITINDYEFERAIAKHSVNGLFELQVSDGQQYTVHIAEIQKHPIRRNFLHIDLHQIQMNVEQTFRVPLAFTGSPAGVKEGGILEIHNHFVEIKCLPANLPDKIEVDLSAQGLNEVLYAKDVVLPQDVQLESELMMVLTTVNAIGEEKATDETETAAEPEMIKEKKADPEKADKA